MSTLIIFQYLSGKENAKSAYEYPKYWVRFTGKGLHEGSRGFVWVTHRLKRSTAFCVCCSLPVSPVWGRAQGGAQLVGFSNQVLSGLGGWKWQNKLENTPALKVLCLLVLVTRVSPVQIVIHFTWYWACEENLTGFMHIEITLSSTTSWFIYILIFQTRSVNGEGHVDQNTTEKDKKNGVMVYSGHSFWWWFWICLFRLVLCGYCNSEAAVLWAILLQCI